MAIYAPQSTINFQNSVRIRGALAAKSILLSNSVDAHLRRRVTDITSLNVATIFRLSNSDWVGVHRHPVRLRARFRLLS